MEELSRRGMFTTLAGGVGLVVSGATAASKPAANAETMLTGHVQWFNLDRGLLSFRQDGIPSYSYFVRFHTDCAELLADHYKRAKILRPGSRLTLRAAPDWDATGGKALFAMVNTDGEVVGVSGIVKPA